MHLPALDSTAIDSIHVIIVYVTMVTVYMMCLLAKKIYYKKKHNLEYIIIPQLQIKSISKISMITAMNIALIITISLLSNQIMGIFFKVYPGARFLIENILIKMGGILFGPIIGIFIGFSTDLLTVILTSSVLNYGYFLSAIINGFLGGLVHLLINMKDQKKIKSAIISISFALIAITYLGIVLNANNGSDGVFRAIILSYTLSFHWVAILVFLLLVGIGCASALITATFAVNKKDDPKYKDKRWVKYCSENYTLFLIMMINFGIYVIVDIISLPLFDKTLSTLPYEQFLICRIITSIPSLIIFSRIIWYIYKLHNNIKGNLGVGSDVKEYGLMPPATEEKDKSILPNLRH